MGQIWKGPPEPVAGFNGASFALKLNIDLALQWIETTDATYTESAMSFMTPPHPTQLSTLKNRGAKVMVYHGVADPIFSGGPATDQFDMLTPLVAWVEQGTEPQAVTATARGTGNAAGANLEVPGAWGASRTRPLCPYPKVARYNGTGDVNLAASFSCQ